MPAGTPPDKVLEAAKKFAREEFAHQHQHRYAMALHVEQKDNRPVHPHVHLVVKAQRPKRGEGENPTLLTRAGDSVFMRKKLEAVRWELQTGNGVDATQYRALQNVRAQVNERYRDAIQWLLSRGREEEARRFELMQRNLAPVKTENQLIADTLVAHNEGRTMDGQEQRVAR
jgi:hypothetical protein